jgi:hypothetical protein
MSGDWAMAAEDVISEQVTLTEIIKQLIYADARARNTAAARLLDCSSTKKGLDALLGLAFDQQCDELIHTVGNAERHSIATCRSRMGCYKVMGKAELDDETLKACLEEYQNADIGVKRGMFTAISLFAVANKDKVALLEEKEFGLLWRCRVKRIAMVLQWCFLILWTALVAFQICSWELLGRKAC